jgi:hypothetical protein
MDKIIEWRELSRVPAPACWLEWKVVMSRLLSLGGDREDEEPSRFQGEMRFSSVEGRARLSLSFPL